MKGKKLENIFGCVTISEKVSQRHHGLTPTQQRELRAEAKGICMICDVHEDECAKQHAIDHCHSTGQVRGVLCQSCNMGLGFFKDNPALLTKAITYIEDTQNG